MSHRSIVQDALKKEVIQAVIIVENLTERFVPLTTWSPHCFFPLVNVPLLDYTVEWLGNHGIEELFVCTSHVNAVREHLEKSKWSGPLSKMKIKVIPCITSLSYGDMMRELDKEDVIRGDFILVTGDVISNIDIISVLEEHKKRRKFDPSALMTLVYCQADNNHPLHSLEKDVDVIVENQYNKIMSYKRTKDNLRTELSFELLKTPFDMTVYRDLVETGICIASPAVPVHFSDSFDFQSLDRLIINTLTDKEVVDNSVYCHLADGKFGISVSNMHLYHSVSQLVMRMWSYPAVIGKWFSLREYKYDNWNCSHISRTAVIADASGLKQNVTIGAASSIGTGTVIAYSVIGKNCKIGNNVKISHSFLWDGCVIEDNCSISYSLLANDVHLGTSVKLEANCVVGCGVDLESNFSGSELKIISAKASKNDLMAEKVLKAISRNAYAYSGHIDTDNEEENEQHVKSEVEVMVEHRRKWNFVLEDDDGDEDSEAEEDGPLAGFYSEVLDSLETGFNDGSEIPNLILEVNSSRLANNVTLGDVVTYTTKAIFVLFNHKIESVKETSEQLNQLTKILKYFTPLLKNYIANEKSQELCLASMQECANDEVPCLLPFTPKVLHYLYNTDILSEEAVLAWYKHADGPVKKQVFPFVNWLQEADEDSDSVED